MKYYVNCVFTKDGMSFSSMCDDELDLNEVYLETMQCYKNEKFVMTIVSVNEE